MGFFHSVATKAVVTVARGLGLTSPDLYVALGGQPSAAGKIVTVDGALQLDTVWACVRLISQTIATLPLMVYRQDADGHNTVAGRHPLYRILHDQPNADMTATEFWEAIVSNVLLWGNGYAEIGRGVRGDVVALTPMRSDRVAVRRQPDGSPLYVYSWAGRVVELEQADVLHIKGFSLDGVVGLSPISLARQTLGTAIAMEEAAAKVFANGMRPSGYLSSPTYLTAQQREQVRGLLEQFQGSQNTGKVPLMEGGWKFEPVSIPPEDGQLLESRSFSVEQICRWFDVPPIMIGHMEKSTAWGSGMEQMMLWFLTFSLRPHLERIEQAIKRDVIGPADADVVAEFKVDGLLRADSTARAALYSSMGQNGILTRNEMRALENRPRVDGGDDLTVQSNLLPIQDLGKAPAPPQGEPAGAGGTAQAGSNPGGAPPSRGGGPKGRLPFSPAERKARPFDPDTARDAEGRFARAAEELQSLARAAVADPTHQGRVVFGRVPDDRYDEHVGRPTRGYEAVAEAGHVRHVHGRHGPGSGERFPLSPEDYGHLPEILRDGTVTRGGPTRRDGTPTVVVNHTIGEHRFRVVLTVRARKRTLGLQTFGKQEK